MRCDVLIVGGGFGGAATAERLEKLLAAENRRVVLVSAENFLLFSPLLPEAAAGTIEPRHAVIPLRELLHNVILVVGRVTSLDADKRVATVRDASGAEQHVEFGTLVLSPGSAPSVFPIPGLAEHAVGFKTLPDAIWLRNRVLRQMEAATATTDVGERRSLLTFTFVGGGYAGVEALAELESFANDCLRFYTGLARADFRWVLVEARERLLPGLDERLAHYTENVLRLRGIEVHLDTRMESCEDSRVVLSAPGIEPYVSGTIVWAAGQRPSPLVAALGLPTDDQDRVIVDDHLRVGGHEGIFALGDAAAVPNPDGGMCPPTAQHALRQGHACARNVAAVLGVGTPAPFRYRNRGLAVTLGRGVGTAQIRRLCFRGRLAWWMGRSYHLVMMPGLARKARVMTDWTISLLFPRDLTQLGSLGAPSPLAPPAD